MKLPRKYDWIIEWERMRKAETAPPPWVKVIGPLLLKHLTYKLPKLPKFRKDHD